MWHFSNNFKQHGVNVVKQCLTMLLSRQNMNNDESMFSNRFHCLCCLAYLRRSLLLERNGQQQRPLLSWSWMRGRKFWIAQRAARSLVPRRRNRQHSKPSLGPTNPWVWERSRWLHGGCSKLCAPSNSSQSCLRECEALCCRTTCAANSAAVTVTTVRAIRVWSDVN